MIWLSHPTSIRASAILQWKFHLLSLFYLHPFLVLKLSTYCVLQNVRFFTEDTSLKNRSVNYQSITFLSLFDICNSIFKYLSNAKLAFWLVDFLHTNLKRQNSSYLLKIVSYKFQCRKLLRFSDLHVQISRIIQKPNKSHTNRTIQIVPWKTAFKTARRIY